MAFQKHTGDWCGLRARAVILATGGAGALYARTDNAPGATGDGYALAIEGGLEVVDMEFVQFYPLVYAGSGHASIVIPPAYADLGDIINCHGEDIKEKYQLFQKPIASVSRDRLSQAVFREVSLGNGVDGALLLDLRKADWHQLPYSDHFKALFRKKIPFESQPIKITPACHHTMGGVQVNSECQTKLKGLFAAGEVVGGIHGANRMGGNALSEGLVFGQIAGKQASHYADSVDFAADFETGVRSKATERFRLAEPGQKPSWGYTIFKNIKKILWEKVGIIRNESAMKQGVKELEEILELFSAQQANTPRELCKLIECRNGALVGKAIALAALKRTESRGAHYREDFPAEDRQWLKHIHVKMETGSPIAAVGPPINQQLS
jgi:succinate dehydrogenase/fumarate reductase flavoprotein subunit